MSSDVQTLHNVLQELLTDLKNETILPLCCFVPPQIVVELFKNVVVCFGMNTVIRLHAGMHT